MQLSQLAGIHAHWTASIEAGSVEETGPRVGAVAVESHASNLHFTCESPLFKAEKAIVPREALAIQAHNVELERAEDGRFAASHRWSIGGASFFGLWKFASSRRAYGAIIDCGSKCAF